MKAGQARTIAADWVKRVASREDWFQGAFFNGSAIALPDDAELPVTSDVDVVVVVDQAEPPLKLGKFVYRDTLLEVTYLSWGQLASPEEVLSSYHLAGSFRTDTLIADPTSRLRGLQAEVSEHFAEMRWVRRRCEIVMQKIEQGLRSIRLSAPFPDLVNSWLFPTGVTTHIPLVAALRNPTVRLRYPAVRDVLLKYGHGGFYPKLLELLGCSQLTPQQVEHHLDALTRTFDIAANRARTPFFFSSDITAASRPIAIDGSRELIRSGSHREAVFWIAATFARCHKILAADAPDLDRELMPSFEALMADLGIPSVDAFISRAEEVFRFLPRLWEVAEAILLANPDITGK